MLSLCPVFYIAFFAQSPPSTVTSAWRLAIPTILSSASLLQPALLLSWRPTSLRLSNDLSASSASPLPHHCKLFSSRGGTIFLFQPGAPEHLLQLHGDWRSDVDKHYPSILLRARSTVADMAAGLCRPNRWFYKLVWLFLFLSFIVIIYWSILFFIHLHILAYFFQLPWGTTLSLLSLKWHFWPKRVFLFITS